MIKKILSSLFLSALLAGVSYGQASSTQSIQDLSCSNCKEDQGSACDSGECDHSEGSQDNANADSEDANDHEGSGESDHAESH